MNYQRMLSLVVLSSIGTLQGQNAPYWQQHVDYKMEVNMDVKNYQYTGKQELTYTNNSPDTLKVVFYHLFLNAFQPDSEMDARLKTIRDPDSRMAINKSSKENPQYESRIASLKPDEIGYLKVSNLTQDGTPVKYHTEGTILKVELNKPIAPHKSTTFKMDFVDYNAGDTIEGKTRAAQLETSRKQIIPMGNLFAEVSIKRDTTKESAKVKAATTRALADGRYSVYAYQGTTQKGVMTGTMASNTFTPDGGIDGMSLEPGTYTFICVNDKVNTSGNQWTVSRENIETALMGIAENVVIATAPKLQNVTFVMKHVGSRVRVFAHTECNPYIQSNIKATLSSTTNIPQQATFDPASRSFTYGNTAAYSKNDLPALYPYTYLYFFPGTNLADLKVTLNGGTAFKLPVNNNRSWSFQNHSLAPNESYILDITLKYNYKVKLNIL